MVDFSNGNLCGASIELNNVLSKLVDAKTEIESKMDDPASTAAAAFQASQNEINALTSKLQTLEISPLSKLNLQSEIESLLSQVPGSVGYGIALAKITLEFKDDIENKGLTLETILSIAATAQNEICDVVPNFEKESGSIEPAVEKPPAVKQAAKPAEPETPHHPKKILKHLKSRKLQKKFLSKAVGLPPLSPELLNRQREIMSYPAVGLYIKPNMLVNM